jgi:hypothetical protein
LAFAIVIEGAMRPMVTGLVQPVHGRRFEMRPWTIERSHQGMNGDLDRIARFCDIADKCNLVSLEFESSKISLLL